MGIGNAENQTSHDQSIIANSSNHCRTAFDAVAQLYFIHAFHIALRVNATIVPGMNRGTNNADESDSSSTRITTVFGRIDLRQYLDRLTDEGFERIHSRRSIF